MNHRLHKRIRGVSSSSGHVRTIRLAHFLGIHQASGNLHLTGSGIRRRRFVAILAAATVLTGLYFVLF